MSLGFLDSGSSCGSGLRGAGFQDEVYRPEALKPKPSISPKPFSLKEFGNLEFLFLVQFYVSLGGSGSSRVAGFLSLSLDFRV